MVNYLDGYSNYLQVDGYQAYEKTDASLVGCWAHARRKFIEAKQVQGKRRQPKPWFNTVRLHHSLGQSESDIENLQPWNIKR